ncbi:MAG: hypothetical protein WA461_01050 [Nitrososphaeraceae archaeon]
MNAKFLLVVMTMAAALLVGATTESSLAQPIPPYTVLDEASATTNNGGVLFASIEALDTIPRFPDQFIESVLVFGYAWVDSDTLEGIVAAIHPEFRDSNQNPDAWHTHPVQLSSGDGTSSDFCIEELGTSQGGIRLNGNVMDVRMPNTFTDGITPNAAASFIVAEDPDCQTTELGVTVLNGPVETD